MNLHGTGNATIGRHKKFCKGLQSDDAPLDQQLDDKTKSINCRGCINPLHLQNLFPHCLSRYYRLQKEKHFVKALLLLWHTNYAG